MFLNEYLSSGYKLFTDTRGIFEQDLLIGRFTSIFGNRTMRIDFSPEQITATGQNVIDCNITLLTQLFEYAKNFDPLKMHQSTITKTGNSTNNGTDDNTRTNTGDRTTTNDTTDTTKNTGTTSTEANLTDNPNNTTAVTKSAYNATASRPYETTSNTGNNTSKSNATRTDDLTATITRAGAITNTDNLTEKNNRITNNSNDYSETISEYGVSNADEIRIAFEKFIQPYDYLCNLIAKEVCEAIW